MNYYYSGQGSLLVAERNSDGTPKGFLEIGNVPTLEISVEVTKYEHKESESGARAVDLTIIQEKKGTFSMTLESISPENLAMAFWGESAVQSGASQTDVVVVARVHADNYDYRVPIIDSAGKIYAGVSSVVVGNDATPTTTYEFGTSASDVLSLNGWVDEANGTLIIFNTALQTSKGAAVNITEAQDLYLDFTDSDAVNVHAFTESSLERWVRFEGMNTLDDKVVIVDMFKASLDPLQGYGLINEEIGSLDISGSILYDVLQPGTSKFFRQLNITA